MLCENAESNVVLVSGAQQSNSVVHIYVSIHIYILFHISETNTTLLINYTPIENKKFLKRKWQEQSEIDLRESSKGRKGIKQPC